MNYIQDINDYFQNENLVRILNDPWVVEKISVSVLNEQGFLKKCIATVLSLEPIQPMQIGKSFFDPMKTYHILKVDLSSEYKFIPLIKDIEIGNLILNKQLNPPSYFQAVEALTNNVSNATSLDESFFRLNTYILVLQSK